MPVKSFKGLFASYRRLEFMVEHNVMRRVVWSSLALLTGIGTIISLESILYTNERFGTCCPVVNYVPIYTAVYLSTGWLISLGALNLVQVLTGWNPRLRSWMFYQFGLTTLLLAISWAVESWMLYRFLYTEDLILYSILPLAIGIPAICAVTAVSWKIFRFRQD